MIKGQVNLKLQQMEKARGELEKMKALYPCDEITAICIKIDSSIVLLNRLKEKFKNENND